MFSYSRKDRSLLTVLECNSSVEIGEEDEFWASLHCGKAGLCAHDCRQTS